MSTKARITSDFATPNDVASRLRIAPSRAAELRRQLFDLHVTQPDGTVVRMQVKSALRKNVASRSKKK